MSTRKNDMRTGPLMREWFESNADEYLTLDDICVKFGCTAAQARNHVERLRGEGVIASAHVYFRKPRGDE